MPDANTHIRNKIARRLAQIEVIEPFAAADVLVETGLLEPGKKAETAAIILTTPTDLFLFDSVRLLIEKILHSGSDVIVWTQGDPRMQTAKYDTSGLAQLGKGTRGKIKCSAATDKISLIDGLVTEEYLADKKRLIICDDKSNQLLRTYQGILKLKEVEHRSVPDDQMYRWVRFDPKNRDILPPGFTSLKELADFIKADFAEIESVSELPALAHTLYLLDFDRTLMDTDRWISTVVDRIVTEVYHQ